MELSSMEIVGTLGFLGGVSTVVAEHAFGGKAREQLMFFLAVLTSIAVTYAFWGIEGQAQLRGGFGDLQLLHGLSASVVWVYGVAVFAASLFARAGLAKFVPGLAKPAFHIGDVVWDRVPKLNGNGNGYRVLPADNVKIGDKLYHTGVKTAGEVLGFEADGALRMAIAGSTGIVVQRVDLLWINPPKR